MRLVKIFTILLFFIFILSCIPSPVKAQGIEDIITTAFFSPVPEYRMSAQDHISEGDQYQKLCQQYTDLYVKQYQKESYDECVAYQGINCSVLLSTDFHDPKLRIKWQYQGIHPDESSNVKNYKETMDAVCKQAEKEYDMALQKAKDADNHKDESTTWEHVATLYHTEGNYEYENQAKTAAAIAYNLIVPLPPWIVLIGLFAGGYLCHKRIKRKKKFEATDIK
ncbi:MAG: hypothetical protein ABR887_08045 [Methanoregulaceae archaeon]